MVFTDLDRTLLRDDKTVSALDYHCLEKLGRLNIIRVIATGRSLFSLRKVIPNKFPVDYVIFSSGAGIYDWMSRKILFRHHLSQSQITAVLEILRKHNTDFMVHHRIPDNHYFYFHGEGHNNHDFHRRIELYRDYAQPLTEKAILKEACQIIAIFPEAGYNKYQKIRNRLSGVNVIRTTSPLDHQSHWMEIFPEGVSKAAAAARLSQKLGISRKNTLGIGNDYNDEKLLTWTGIGFMVANGPDELKPRFNSVSSNQQNGFTEAIEKTGGLGSIL